MYLFPLHADPSYAGLANTYPASTAVTDMLFAQVDHRLLHYILITTCTLSRH